MIDGADASTMAHMPQPSAQSVPPRVAVVVSRYNALVTDRLLEGSLGEFARRWGNAEPVDVWHAPGSFELPALCDAALRTGRYRGAVTLGCIVRGETTHDQHIAAAVAQGVVDISVRHGRPVTFGVLTVNTPEQAQERAGGRHGNKGADAMGALLDCLEVIDAAGRSDAPGSTYAITSTINDKTAGAV